mmetsp:Transcript_9208/g.22780  ORF Transcript_9208/g.22780 Transcript_9208/m.22780 type:complete len:262 (+) Transcript_9208:617-1402(+)
MGRQGLDSVREPAGKHRRNEEGALQRHGPHQHVRAVVHKVPEIAPVRPLRLHRGLLAPPATFIFCRRLNQRRLQMRFFRDARGGHAGVRPPRRRGSEEAEGFWCALGPRGEHGVEARKRARSVGDEGGQRQLHQPSPHGHQRHEGSRDVHGRPREIQTSGEPQPLVAREDPRRRHEDLLHGHREGLDEVEFEGERLGVLGHGGREEDGFEDGEEQARAGEAERRGEGVRKEHVEPRERPVLPPDALRDLRRHPVRQEVEDH